MSTTHRAKIIRSDNTGLWVSVPSLGDAEFGPLESVVSDLIIKPKYTVGDRVIIEQIGAIPEDFIVIGHSARTIGTPPEWTGGNIDASQVVSGVLDSRRMAHIRSDSTGRAWFTTRVDGGWGGDSTTLAMSPPSDPGWTSALELRVDNVPTFVVDKTGVITQGKVLANNIDKMTASATHTNLLSKADAVTEDWVFQLNGGAGTAGLIYDNSWKVQWNTSGVMTAGTVPAERVDKIASSTSFTYIQGRSGPYASGANNTTILVDAGNGNTGGLVNGSYVWRFDSNGTLVTGTIPAARVSGRVAGMNHIASNPSSATPYAIFGVNPGIVYDTATTALRLQERSGSETGERFSIFDASRKVLIHANADSAGDYIAMLAAYTRTTTVAANMVAFTTSGAIGRSTSLRSAKVAIEDAPDAWAERVWNLRPRTWFDKDDAQLVSDNIERASIGEDVDWESVVAAPIRRIPGFVAEEVEEAGLEELLIRDDSGALSGLAYDRFAAALLVAMKAERQKRLDLEDRLGTLVSRIEALEGGVAE